MGSKKASRVTNRAGILWLLIACLFFAGCQSRAIVPSSYDITSPQASKIPMRVNLYLSPEFRHKAFVGNTKGTPVPVSIGESMSSGAERSIRQVFQEVAVVDDLNYEDVSSTQIDAYVTPEIVDVENILTGFPPFSKWDSSITCKWTITTPDGKVLYVNTIVGEGKFKAMTSGFTFADRVGKSMIPAIQDHYDKLIKNLSQAPWWEGAK